MKTFSAKPLTFAYLWVLAALTNGLLARTFIIDDTDSQVAYSPLSQWSAEPGCPGCVSIQLDSSKVQGGGWHDTTFIPGNGDRSFTITFSGTGVQVYNILANNVPAAPTTETHLTFMLDGASFGPSFDHSPSDSPDPEYRQLVYSVDNLNNGSHTLLVQARPDVESVILFDYAMVTVAEPDIPPPIVVTTTATSVGIQTASIASPSLSSSISTSSLSSLSSLFTPSSSSSVSASSLITTPSTSLSSTSMSQKGPIPIPPAPNGTTTHSDTTTQTSSQPRLPVSTPSNIDTEAEATRSSAPIGLIAGLTAGGIGTLIVLTMVIFLLRRRSKRRQSYAYLRKSRGDVVSAANNEYVDARGTSPPPGSTSNLIYIGRADGQGAQRSWRTTMSTTDSMRAPSEPSDILRPLSVSDTVLRGMPRESMMEPAAPSSFVLSRRPSMQTPERESGSEKWHAEEREDIPEVPPIPPQVLSTRTTAQTTTTMESIQASNGVSSGLPVPGSTILQEEVQMLWEEVARLRAQQEAPPRYDQA